jgi:hypothetical protein
LMFCTSLAVTTTRPRGFMRFTMRCIKRKLPAKWLVANRQFQIVLCELRFRAPGSTNSCIETSYINTVRSRFLKIVCKLVNAVKRTDVTCQWNDSWRISLCVRFWNLLLGCLCLFRGSSNKE